VDYLNSTFERTHFVRTKAAELGFSFVGFSKAEELTEEARKLEQWLNQGMHGDMHYMGNHFEKRIDPTKLVEGAKSVVTLLYNYHNPDLQKDPEAPKISQYAYGKDYHKIVKAKLRDLMAAMEERIGAIEGRCFVDSAPILERDWAKRSGLGWIGKNTLLINKGEGSFFFLAELIIDVPFDYDSPIKDYCGRCRRCIDACPTQAIHEDGYWMDGSKCISYFTIELKEAIPQEMKGQFDNWMFGCDVCQQVCPWNRFAKRHNEPDFEPHPELLELSATDWVELTEDVFRKVFKKSPVKRTKYSGLQRNIEFLKKI
jgi:epoxyqueuosine reductase